MPRMGYRGASLATVFLLLSGVLFAQPERPIRRPTDNKLALETIDVVPRADTPEVVEGVTSRLVFHTSPLSGKGLLSEQIRAALKALDKANGSAVFLKFRVFVAGTGDVRRFQSIVSEDFADKKLPLPAVTAVLVGALPGENTQVVIESISEEKKRTVNPAGLIFVSSQPSVAQLQGAMQSAGAKLVRVSCFADTLARAEAARIAAAKAFPGAPGAFVQATRYGIGDKIQCEGVGRLPARKGAPLVERVPNGVLARMPKLLFTAAQVVYGEDGAKEANERLGEAVSGEILMATHYSVAGSGERSGVIIEGLSSQDASAAVEAVVAVK